MRFYSVEYYLIEFAIRLDLVQFDTIKEQSDEAQCVVA